MLDSTDDTVACIKEYRVHSKFIDIISLLVYSSLNPSCPDFLHGKESSTKEPKEKKKHKFLGAKLPKLKSSGHKSDQAASAAAQAQATAASTVGASRQSTASAPPLHTIDEVCELIT